MTAKVCQSVPPVRGNILIDMVGGGPRQNTSMKAFVLQLKHHMTNNEPQLHHEN